MAYQYFELKAEENTLHTPEEAAAYLRISTRTLQEMRSLKTGPEFIRVGRQILYPKLGLVVWMFVQAIGGRSNG